MIQRGEFFSQIAGIWPISGNPAGEQPLLKLNPVQPRELRGRPESERLGLEQTAGKLHECVAFAETRLSQCLIRNN